MAGAGVTSFKNRCNKNRIEQNRSFFLHKAKKKLFLCIVVCVQTLAFAATNENEDSFFIIGGYNCSSRTHKNDKISTSTTRIEVNVVEPTTMSEEKNSLTAIRVKSSIFNSC